jgi:hypothetical protein
VAVFNSLLGDYVNRRNDRMQGALLVTVAALDALQPYRGGTGERMWQLSQLNIIEKHRTLLTVGSCYRSFDLGPHAADARRQRQAPAILRRRRQPQPASVSCTGWAVLRLGLRLKRAARWR